MFLSHTCTIAARVTGAVDGENNATYTWPTPVNNVPCKYRAVDRVRRDDLGAVIVNVPTITVAHDFVINPGDRVSNIVASDGAVLQAGPLFVDYVQPSAGLGPVLKKRVVLRGGDVV